MVVSVLLADKPHSDNVSVEVARDTIERITGDLALGRKQLGPNAVCDTRGNAPESLEQQAVRCPAGGVRDFMYAGLISIMQRAPKEAEVSTFATVTEARDFAEAWTRQCMGISWCWITLRRGSTYYWME